MAKEGEVYRETFATEAEADAFVRGLTLFNEEADFIGPYEFGSDGFFDVVTTWVVEVRAS